MSTDKSDEKIGDLEESKLPPSIPVTNEPPQNAGPQPPKRFHFLSGGSRYNKELSKVKKDRREREKSNGTPAKKFKESIRKRLCMPMPKSPLVTTTSMAGAPTPATLAPGCFKPNAAPQQRAADHVPTAVAFQQISDDGDTRFLIIESQSQKPNDEGTTSPMDPPPPNDHSSAEDDTVPLQRK
uniref:Uncharacterized protein n=1 Tax=Panagrolaimus sp. PS1159 TaxID=55785 RepID=A0AC35G9U8_9BILA